MKKILSKTVGFQENVWSSITKEEEIGSVLNNIKGGKYKQPVLELRKFINVNNLKLYSSNKKRLPGVTFCGTFSMNEQRRIENLKKYNEIIVVDIDKLDSRTMSEVYNVLLLDEHVFSFWVSPSNKGFKGLVPIKFYDNDSSQDLELLHKSAFRKLVEYFNEKYQIHLDESGSDLSRLCFYSYDPELILKNNTKYFSVIESDIIKGMKSEKSNRNSTRTIKAQKNQLYNPVGRNHSRSRTVLQSIIKYLHKRNLSITYEYDKWYRVAYAISSTFTYDIGWKYYQRICKLDGEKYDEKASNDMLLYCYQNNTNELKFSTIIHFAKEKGYKSGDST